MLIPPELLDPATLTRLLEDFVTREGTDNGDDTPLEAKVAQVRRALARNEAVIVFDPASEQCRLMPVHEVPSELLEEAGGGNEVE